MSFRLLLLVLSLFSMSSLVSAQQALTGTINLRDALEAVLQANPRLDSFPIREDALLGQRESAALNPPLRINGGAEEFLGTGDLRDFTATEVNIGLSQVIEMGGKRGARLGVVNRRLELLEAEQRVVELDLLGQTTQRFIDVTAAQERLVLQARATAIVTQTIALIEPLVTAGQAPQLELERAEAARARAEAAEAMARSMLGSARIRLAAMWSSSEPTFDAVTANLLAVGDSGSLQALLANLDSNPDIEIFANEARLREAELRQANTLRESNIEWSAGVRHLRELDDTALTFGVSVPLFSHSRASGAIREAQAGLQEVEARRAALLNQLRGEISALYQQLDQTIAEVGLLQSRVLPSLQIVLEQSRVAYENGTYSYLELITAQREYLDAELALINSAAAAHSLRAEIERLTGQALPAR